MVTHEDSHSWARGHVEPWWGQSHRGLDYINEPFNDDVSLAEWRRLGYTQTKFTGDLYDMRFAEPQWMARFRQRFPMKNFCWSVYRMGPGTVLPEHGDTYRRFREINHLQPDQSIMRVIVFLEDWQRGHYLEMDGHPITQWRAGDWVCWQNDFLHSAANMGKTDRYTLQLTGT
jgi:hypothetical protein